MDFFSIFIVFAIVFLVSYFGWILILLILPSQISFNQYRKLKLKNKKFNILGLLGIPYWLWEKIFRDGWQRYMLYKVGMIPSFHARRFVYRSLGAEIGKNAVFYFKTEIRAPFNMKIGKGAIIGDNALLDARCGLEIGENVMLSSNVSIYTLQHDHRDPYLRCTNDVIGKITIGNRAWIGSNVIILPGVTIGEGSVCCAGCVVTKDVEPYSVVAGIPARKVNKRPKDLRYENNGKTCRLY